MAFKILSFCGGGIRGLASAVMLNELYKTCPGINIAKDADMLAGTSTGAGIVAWLIKHKDQNSVQGLIDYYWASTEFFKHQSTDPDAPGYDVTTFANRMQKEYSTPLNQIKDQKVLLTSFNVGNTVIQTVNNQDKVVSDPPWGPVLFNNFQGSQNADTVLGDAVVCSSAMPGMFAGYNSHVDGAFVNHDPTLAAIALAVKAGYHLEDIVVICFGTGFMANSVGPVVNATKDSPGWGAAQWMQRPPISPDYHLEQLLINQPEGVAPVLNMILNGTSTNLVPMLSGIMLSLGMQRYAYLNPTLDKFIPENEYHLDPLRYLEEQAKNVTSSPEFSTAMTLVNNFWAPSIQASKAS